MARALAVTISALVVAGCAIDERTLVVRPDSIVIGSFEAGTLQADDPRFGAWSAYSHGTALAMVTSSLRFFDDGCPSSNWCLALDWELSDAADGASTIAGTGDRLAALAPIDLSGLSRILFSHQYQHVGACQDASSVNVIFQCDELQSAYQAVVALSSDWVTTSVALNALVEAESPSPHDVARADCLAHTTAILFQVDSDLADGTCVSGSFLVDNVNMR